MSQLSPTDGFLVLSLQTNDLIELHLLCSRPLLNVIVSDDPVDAEWFIHENQPADGVQSTHWFNLVFNLEYDQFNATIFANELPNAMVRYSAVPFCPGYWQIPQMNKIGFITTVHKRETTENALLFIALSDNELKKLRERMTTNVICKQRSSIYNFLMETY